MEILQNFNKYQTPLEDVLKGLKEEISQDILGAIKDYVYIQKLVASDRPTYKTVKRDRDNKVIVDLSNPHILEDMDYFRQPAITFQKTGKYTEAIRSVHKQSAWAEFWRKEGVKCLTYAVNPSTGDWIPGDYYFYLNYSPILKVKYDDNGEIIDRVFDFPNVYDGDYWFYHYLEQAKKYKDDFIQGMHGACIKARGKGYSFKGAGMLARRFVLGNSLEAQKKIKSLALASEKEYLTKDGILNKFVDIIAHCADHTGWFKYTTKNSWNTMEWISGYQNKDGFAKGKNNEVRGVSMKDNSGKARGKRAHLILYEEFGKFPNFLSTWRTNRPSTEQGWLAWGQMIGFGTGGEEGSDFSGAEEMIYHPEGYRVYGIPNIYDKGAVGNTASIFFSSVLFNLEGCFDKNGNSDLIKALRYIMYDRWNIKYNTTGLQELSGHIAEHPIGIAEAIMRKEGNLFPTVDLKAYRDEIRLLGESFFETSTPIELVSTNGKDVKLEPTAKRPIRTFPLGKNDVAGAIEIFSLPIKDSSGVIPNRYIMGVDPYANDQGTSLGSVFVFDCWTQSIVAEYTGRPTFADDFHEICRKLAIFYNAKIMYENNIKGLYSYFSQHNCIYLLAESPQILLDKSLSKSKGFGNTALGFRASLEINNYNRNLIREWLLKEAHFSFQEFNNGEQITHKKNMHTIKSVALLEELISWTPIDNFDRVSALGAVMLYNEEMKKYIQGYTQKVKEVDTFLSSDYFTKNYDDRFSYNKVPETSFKFHN